MNICGCWVSSMKLPFLGWRFSRPFTSLCSSSFSPRIMTIQSCSSPSSSASLSTSESKEMKKEASPWLIVGLGNPGKKYAATRHNVGFEMVDTIAEAEGISMTTVSFKSLFGKGFIGDVPVILAKPQTYMNSSGESVGAIVSYYKIPLKQVLVIFDDLDLPFAKLRLLPKGGHGGHNG
ncbi:hypothetical protein AAZX31_05G217800 [Glycine max]